MSVGLYTHTTRATGTILTAAIYNADHQNHISNQNPEMTGGLSDTLAEHQSMTDPGSVGSETLAASIAEELTQLRFCIDRIVGKTHWYEAPATNLNTIGGEIVDLTVAQSAQFKGDLAPAQITANQNNYAPTGHVDAFRFILTSDAARDITGLVEGIGNTGRIVDIYNDGTFNITLKNEDAASSAANRFSFGADLVIPPKQGILIQYRSPALRWFLVNSAAVSNLHPTLNGVLFPEVTPPSAPAANNIEVYCKDDGGTSRLAYKDSADVETIIKTTAPVRIYGEYATNEAITATIPDDDTIPQSGEGFEIISVSMPALASASNRVRFHFVGHWGGTCGSETAFAFAAALFKDSGADALYAIREEQGTGSLGSLEVEGILAFDFEFAPGAATAATYKIRVGPLAGFTTTPTRNYRMNGNPAGRKFGGVLKATLTVQEVIV